MRIKNLLRLFFLFIFLALFERQAQATHLYGSEFTYEFIGPSGNTTNPFRYKFSYKIYSGDLNNARLVSFNVYRKNGTLITNFSANPATNNNPIAPAIPPGCVVPNIP